MVIKNADIPDYVRDETLPEHLGGHLGTTQMDEGALEWAIKTFNIQSFLDIGCGTGRMVRLAQVQGLTAMGIDGDDTVDRKGAQCLIRDFTKSPIDLAYNYDLAWCVEFLEHVEEKYILNYMPAFRKCKYVIVTYAPPGMPGYHHVNCQTKEYWIEVFKEYDLKFSFWDTIELRKQSTMNIDRPILKRYIKNNGLFFKNLSLTP
tara:strand:+ start:8402 stop:9013 length:612 start_codon:yes stop_codon:yes gene_type:complete